ncbi:MAG: serine hydrolase, partial [Pirellulaceae bacterium]|nr:serine hydrolase [Pirellulaceae bacterium]
IIVGRTTQAKYREQTGQSVAAIAKHHSEDPWDTFFALAKGGAFVLPQSMSEANKILAIQQEFMSYCTDVGPASSDGIAGHPRAFGSFPRLFARYVRDLGAISLERAVASASAVAANEVMAFDRGRIAVGLAADLVLFDHDRLTDQATFAKPDAESVGVRHVLVAGVPVLKNGQMTDARPGRVLRGPGYQKDKAAWNVSTGKPLENRPQFDQMVREFMQEHAIPGLAIAVKTTREPSPKSKSDLAETVTISRGYGYADLATREPVTSQHLFRIASLSKPITAVAILKLIEQGKFQLQDRIFDLLNLDEAAKAAGDKFDKRWRDITVQHLLQHRGGWDRDKSFDAMFQSVRFAGEQNVDAPAGPRSIVQSMLSQQLDFDPGQRYAYSNFGYCLLGRLIELKSGKDYETLVKQEVLKPLGIESMRLGKTRLSERAAGEVRYYHPGQGKSVFQNDLREAVPLPYGAWYIEAMDAHGGWIASADDLLRFVSAFDDPANCKVLSQKSIELMFERPEGLAGYEEGGAPKEVHYSLGWMNRSQGEGRTNRWHTGSLDGTATIMIRRHDGKSMVALINTRSSPSAAHLGREIDKLLHRLVDM